VETEALALTMVIGDACKCADEHASTVQLGGVCARYMTPDLL